MFERWRKKKEQAQYPDLAFSTEEKRQQFSAVLERASSRIPPISERSTASINDIIASLSDLRIITNVSPRHREIVIKGMEVYVYLRDAYDAKTMGDVLDILADGKVNPGIISKWIREDRFSPPLKTRKTREGAAVWQGYPEFRKELEQRWNPQT